MNYATLLAELDNDPLKLGYRGMTEKEMAASLNAPTRTITIAVLPGLVIANAFNVVEFNALTSEQKDTARWITTLGDEIPLASSDGKATNLRAMLESLFGPGSVTRANLHAALQKSVSRARELGLPRIEPGNIQEARRLQNPPPRVRSTKDISRN